jgi:hypothetical protein
MMLPQPCPVVAWAAAWVVWAASKPSHNAAKQKPWSDPGLFVCASLLSRQF